MVIVADTHHPHARTQDHALGYPGGGPGKGAATQHKPLGRDDQRTQQQAPEQGLGTLCEDVRRTLIGVRQVLPGVAQGREVANVAAAGILDVFFLKRQQRKGGRVGALEAITHAASEYIEHTADLVVVEHLLRCQALRVLQCAPEMQRVEQGDQDISGNDGERHHAQPRAEHVGPAFAGLWVPAQSPEKKREGNHQQENQCIGPEQNGFHRCQTPQDSRTRGSAQV